MIGQWVCILVRSIEELVAPSIAKTDFELASSRKITCPSIEIRFTSRSHHFKSSRCGIGIPSYRTSVSTNPDKSRCGKLYDVEHSTIIELWVGIYDDGTHSHRLVSEFVNATLYHIVKCISTSRSVCRIRF